MAVLPDPIPATAVTPGPCHPWTTIAQVRDRCANIPVSELSDEVITHGINVASLYLWTQTGRRLGLCERTVMPCYDGTHQQNGQGPYPAPPLATQIADINYAESIYDTGYGAGTYRMPLACGCALPMLERPGPIAAVTRIRYNGADVDLTTVKIKTGGINSRRALIRTGGETWWCCNNSEADPGTATTDTTCPAWDVTYLQGTAINETAQTIAAALAEQEARQLCGAPCDNNYQSLSRVTRKGVVKEFDTTQETTGLRIVDDWVDAMNPYRLHRRPQLARPDDPEPRRLWSWVDAA